MEKKIVWKSMEELPTDGEHYIVQLSSPHLGKIVTTGTFFLRIRDHDNCWVSWNGDLLDVLFWADWPEPATQGQ